MGTIIFDTQAEFDEAKADGWFSSQLRWIGPPSEHYPVLGDPGLQEDGTLVVSHPRLNVEDDLLVKMRKADANVQANGTTGQKAQATQRANRLANAIALAEEHRAAGRHTAADAVLRQTIRTEAAGAGVEVPPDGDDPGV